MRIQHNIMAMNAYRNYNNNNKALSGNLEKLSSGYKINRAGDDAAGLAISEKMRAQITGLDAAQKNVKDGISLVKTAEGAMQEIQDMLNRMDYLATQSANGTYDNDVDRANLQKEVQALKSEINRIADSANFNGIKLLDGSRDADGVVAGTGSTSDFKNFSIPAVGTTNGTDTVLHTEGATGTTGTEFSVDLHNVKFDNRVEGNQVDIKIGNDTLSLKVLTAGTNKDMTASDIVNAIKAGSDANYEVSFGGTVLNAGDKIQIGGQDFTLSGTGSKLTFTQDAPPTTDDEVVAGDMSVSVKTTIGDPAKVTGKATKIYVDKAKVTGTVQNNATVVTDGKVDASGLDTDAITAAADKAGIASGDVKISATGNKLELKIGNDVIGTATVDWTQLVGVAGGTAKAYNFETADGTALGSIEITPGTVGNDIDDTTFAAGLDTNLDFSAAAATPTKGVDTAGLLTDDAKEAILAAAKEKGITADGELTISYDAAGTTGSKFSLKIGNTVIGTADEANVGTKLDFVTAGGDAIATVNTTGTPAEADFTEDISTGVNFVAEVAGTSADTVDYNTATTDIKNVGLGDQERLASTVLTIDKGMITEGSSIQIGKTNYIFKTDKASTLTAATGSKIVDVSDLDPNDGDYLSDVLTRLTDAAADNTTYSVGHKHDAPDKITVVEKPGQTDYVKDGKSTLTSKNAIAETLGYKGVDVAATAGAALTLQIGDTSDDFNQLGVNIKDMHVEAMVGLKRDADGNVVKDADGNVQYDSSKTISSIDISTQEGAQEAVNVIRDAINYVSGVRGDLGAIQNRLDHTANNLSVMAENIQDAESTIRDTDVANEMMSYVKNNILVQSAQAMLAQANQVPQGVLQLLG